MLSFHRQTSEEYQIGCSADFSLLVWTKISSARQQTLQSTRIDDAVVKHKKQYLTTLGTFMVFKWKGNRKRVSIIFPLFCRNYTDTQVFTGSQSDEKLTAIVESFFRQFGLRETGHEQDDVYHVRLCVPDNGLQNKIEILGRYTCLEFGNNVYMLESIDFNTNMYKSMISLQTTMTMFFNNTYPNFSCAKMGE